MKVVKIICDVCKNETEDSRQVILDAEYKGWSARTDICDKCLDEIRIKVIEPKIKERDKE